MNLQEEKTPRASQHYMGWRAQRTTSFSPVAGEFFLLTLPFIERAYRKLEALGLDLSAAAKPQDNPPNLERPLSQTQFVRGCQYVPN
jgi:hypothetical protein